MRQDIWSAFKSLLLLLKMSTSLLLLVDLVMGILKSLKKKKYNLDVNVSSLVFIEDNDCCFIILLIPLVFESLSNVFLLKYFKLV